MARMKRTKKGNVAGPSDNPAANLLFADIMVRTGSYAFKQIMQRRMLRDRYDRQTAKEIVNKRSLAKTATSFVVAKVATKSLPGALVVGGGMLVKTLFDRSQSHRAAKKAGDAALAERIED